jgi:hypothetical protein
MKKTENRFHKRTDEELSDFIKKLELQALETAEERLPLYLKVKLKDAVLYLTSDAARVLSPETSHDSQKAWSSPSMVLIHFSRSHKKILGNINTVLCKADAQTIMLP